MGLTYSELLDKFIINPLGLENSGPSPGDDEKAVIPPGDEVGWGTDYGINAPYVIHLFRFYFLPMHSVSKTSAVGAECTPLQMILFALRTRFSTILCSKPLRSHGSGLSPDHPRRRPPPSLGSHGR